MAAVLALVVCTALAMSFSSTRGIGILGTGVLIVLFPVITLTAMALFAVAYFIHKKGSKP
jgi:hypothetical protein